MFIKLELGHEEGFHAVSNAWNWYLCEFIYWGFKVPIITSYFTSIIDTDISVIVKTKQHFRMAIKR